MQRCRLNKQQMPRRGRTLTLALLGACAAAQATEVPTLNGQWVGNSLLDGSREAAKTSLSLGAPDADGATFRLEDRSTCTLKQGTYSARQNSETAAWSLTFKEARGGEACERLARGEFVLHPGSGPRKLEFDVTYPASDGTQNHRRGVLSRYP
jgi:hypothetical protein